VDANDVPVLGSLIAHAAQERTGEPHADISTVALERDDGDVPIIELALGVLQANEHTLNGCAVVIPLPRLRILVLHSLSLSAGDENRFLV
jgi:hypothetical protein